MKCTIGKDGRKYYFKDGKRVKNPGITTSTTTSTPSKSSIALTKRELFIVTEKRMYSSIGSSLLMRLYFTEGDVLQKQREIVEGEEAKFAKECLKNGDDSYISYRTKGKCEYSLLSFSTRMIAKSNTRMLYITYVGDRNSLNHREGNWF